MNLNIDKTKGFWFGVLYNMGLGNSFPVLDNSQHLGQKLYLNKRIKIIFFGCFDTFIKTNVSCLWYIGYHSKPLCYFPGLLNAVAGIGDEMELWWNKVNSFLLKGMVLEESWCIKSFTQNEQLSQDFRDVFCPQKVEYSQNQRIFHWTFSFHRSFLNL